MPRLFDKRLRKTCMNEVKKYIDHVFDKSLTVADAIAELPFNQELCFAGWRDCDARYTVFHALCQREIFRQERPLEVLELRLELPLAPLACAALVDSPDHWRQLVGLFGNSLIHANWSFLHPNFRDYCRCLMACGGTSCSDAVQALRADPALQAKFPPRRLTDPLGTVLHFADQTYSIGD
jgi:hypothetical protein